MEIDPKGVTELLDRLAEEIEISKPDSDDLLAVLIRAILSQATSSTNRDRAFETLLDTYNGDWRLVAEADPSDIAVAIRVGGLAKQKSARIHKILEEIIIREGEPTLEFLKEESVEDGYAFLTSLPGVGPQTATFTLGWAAGADLCPINTGVKRVASRLGWLTKTTDRAMHDELHEILPAGRRFEAHMLMVRHARLTCLKVPNCGDCVIESMCEFDPSAA